MKSAKQIDKWFCEECESVLKEIPTMIKDLAKNNHKHIEIIAENIALKKCFNKKAVLNYLINNL